MGPVPVQGTDDLIYDYFDDESHTTNGHSIVLKVHYGSKSVLLGGDLNIQAENHLLRHYKGRESVFEADVAKSCHHGSSEFTIPFMKAMNPFATVISSGDNESHAHPRADAIGAAGRYSRGKLPLVFSTELARSTNSSREILYGMINCRTDGEVIILAQMKEARKGADVWDSYELPFNPRRH